MVESHNGWVAVSTDKLKIMFRSKKVFTATPRVCGGVSTISILIDDASPFSITGSDAEKLAAALVHDTISSPVMFKMFLKEAFYGK